MAKVAVALRLRPETLARLDAYAKARGSSRQVLLESFVESRLEDAERGVVGLPVEVARPVVAKPQARRMETSADWALARQRKLNEAKSRASR
jgi:predicted DNA-binding protein